VHVHGYRPVFFYITWFLKNWKSFDFYFTDHNARLFDILGFWGEKIYRIVIKKLSLLILVNNDVRSIYKKKCHVALPNIIVRNAFLPPPLNEKRQILQTYSWESKNFVNTRKPLIVANASRIVFFNDIDLYGLDICVELIYKCKSRFPNIGLLFALANSETDSSYLEALKERIDYLGVSHNFHFMTGQKELWPLFKLADLCVRPTVSDGDAISVRESLYFGCPVIASDAVQRPAGSVTFKTRDIDDLYQKVGEILFEKTN
jgi:glycosyltransferase involved in cell wall biosynthesis